MKVSVADKENLRTPTKLNKRKSYSILSPISNVSNTTVAKAKNTRVISETTGLAKFSLSPSKIGSGSTSVGKGTPTSSPTKSGLPVYVPVNEAIVEEVEEEEQGYEELMTTFAVKQREMIESEKKIEVIKFELLEISAKLERSKELKKPRLGQQLQQQQANSINLNSLKKKASSIFNNSPIKKSSISNFSSYINKVQDQFSNNLNEIKIKDEVKSFLNKQSNEIDELTNKTSKFVNELFTNLSPKKTDNLKENDLLNNSFNFDNLNENNGEIYNKYILSSSILVSDDEDDRIIYEQSEESGIVDIDDYSSDEN